MLFGNVQKIHPFWQNKGWQQQTREDRAIQPKAKFQNALPFEVIFKGKTAPYDQLTDSDLNSAGQCRDSAPFSEQNKAEKILTP